MGLPETRSPASIAEYLINVLDSSERTPYLGEPISQLQHSLQCAAQAVDASADEPTQVAALLHDIGQFVPAADLRALVNQEAQNLDGQSSKNGVGRVGHDILAGRLLAALGFPEKITRLVASHVDSKRYLCAVDKTYYDKLSDASKTSLKYQGGPMQGAEVQKFAADKWCAEMCQLRVWDDQAKIEGLEVPGLEIWRAPIERQLQHNTAV